MLLEYAFVVLALCFAALWFFWQQARPRRIHLLDNVPGPSRLPIVGSIYHLKSDPVKIAQQNIEWHGQYGPIYRLNGGPFHSVLLARSDYVEAILKSSTNLTKSREYDQMQSWLGTGLLVSTNDKWRYRRKLLTPAFHFQILKDFVPIFHEQAEILVQRLSEAVSKSDGAIDLCPYFSDLTLDIICETAMDTHLNAQQGHDTAYLRALYTFTSHSVYRSVRPWLFSNFLWNLHPYGIASKRAVKVMHDFTWQVILARDQSFSDETTLNGDETNAYRQKGRKAFLDLMLQLKREGLLTLADIREEVDTFMFEGHDTTATGLAWAMYCIAAHADVQDRLRREIADVWDEREMLGMEDLTRMPYLDCVLKESQRLFPSVPVIGRKLTEELVLDDKYTIPEGVHLYVSILALHRNETVFPDAKRFDPERFAPDVAEKRHPFAYIPFSGGQRNCIGQRFALLEEKIIVCHLLRHFRFEALQSFDELDPALLLVLRPTKGILVRVSPIMR